MPTRKQRQNYRTVQGRNNVKTIKNLFRTSSTENIDQNKLIKYQFIFSFTVALPASQNPTVCEVFKDVCSLDIKATAEGKTR